MFSKIGISYSEYGPFLGEAAVKLGGCIPGSLRSSLTHADPIESGSRNPSRDQVFQVPEKTYKKTADLSYHHINMAGPLRENPPAKVVKLLVHGLHVKSHDQLKGAVRE